MSAQGAPVRNRQNIPFRTRRSSTRGTPRTLFGSSGAITDHSKSVRSKRAIQTSIVGHLNHCSPKNGIHFMGTSPRAIQTLLALRESHPKTAELIKKVSKFGY